MLLHYIKIALRNLRKYPAQTAISVLGLAAGFVFLTLSGMWVHYENKYDTMHKDYERIYTFLDPYMLNLQTDIEPFERLKARVGLYEKFVSEYPEVEAATYFLANTHPSACWRKVNGMDAQPIQIDTTFIRVFDLPLVQGDYDFLTDENEIALTEEFAKRLFPDETDIIGRQLTLYCEKNIWGSKKGAGERKAEVGAVIKDFGKHSIIQFDIAYTGQFYFPKTSMFPLFVKLHDGVDVEAFAKRVREYADIGLFRNTALDGLADWDKPYGTMTIPISDAHKIVGEHTHSLSWEYLRVFFACSILLVACALINYLVLYLIRLRVRERELALRIVNGSTKSGLMVMFLIEVGFVLIAAIAFGLLGVEWLSGPFTRFANIDMNYGDIMTRSIGAMSVIAIICLALCVVPIIIVRNRTLTGRTRRNETFRKGSLFVQLIVSITFIFCTAVMVHQISFMRNTDWGFNIKGKAQLYLDDDSHANVSVESAEKCHEVAPRIRELPMVIDVMEDSRDISAYRLTINDKIGLSPDALELYTIPISDIHDIGNPSNGFTVLEGTLPREEQWLGNELVITEKVRKGLGLDKAVGKTVYTKRNYGTTRKREERWSKFTIVAVVKDLYFNPTEDADAYVFLPRGSKLNEGYTGNDYLTINYISSERKDFEHRVSEVMKMKFPDIKYELEFSEDAFEKLLRSENNLAVLLGIITAVCILVAVFGVYSIVTLACAQRRKEIALRKIHGATLADILSIFIKEYGLIVLAASAVAFPIGYMIMKEWVAQYVKQAPIAWWIYAVILLAIVLLIALSVGSRVWRTARENPAEVIKRGN